MLIIAKREIKRIFKSPVTYVVLSLFFLTLGLLFYSNLVALVNQNYVPTIQLVVAPMVTLLFLITPAVTMQSINQEYASGTIELLLTSRLREWELVAGKWLGIFLFYQLVIFMTIPYAIILNQLVDPYLEFGIIFSNYLGLVLLTGLLSAIGVSISAIVKNTVLTFVVTLVIVLALLMLSYPAQVVRSDQIVIFNFFDVQSHFYSSFYLGLIRMQDITYFLTLTVFFLFLGSNSIYSRRLR